MAESSPCVIGDWNPAGARKVQPEGGRSELQVRYHALWPRGNRLVVGNLSAKDYVLEMYDQGGLGYIPVSSSSKYTYTWADQQTNKIGISRFSIPSVIQPGQECDVHVVWSVSTTHVPITYVNYFGNWQPGEELARGALYGGTPASGNTYTDDFTFTAPETPGYYRIRFMWFLYSSPIGNFYGGPTRQECPHGFSEVAFRVGYPVR